MLERAHVTRYRSALAEAFRLPAAEVEGARREGLIPRDETIAETRTKDGELVGSWVVSWDGDGVGTCREIGQVARCVCY